MFRRPRRPLASLNNLPPAISQALNEVERLAEAGQFLQAANMLSQLAQAAKARGRLRWAANLQTRAAHLYVEGGKDGEALEIARQALTTFLSLQMGERARQFYQNLGRRLQAHGMTAAAAELSREFNGRLVLFNEGEKLTPGVKGGIRSINVGSEEEKRGVSSQQPVRGRLPAECPGCGAPVRSDRVEWIDAQNAECNYCGAVIPAE